MIGWLSGELRACDANVIIVDVGGVGYKVTVPVSVLTAGAEVGSKIALHVHTQVREDDIALFGFAQRYDLKVFQLLLSVTGIGPKVAIGILSALDGEALVRAVSGEDTKTLVRIPGLGLKTAQRLVLELKDKLLAMSLEITASSPTSLPKEHKSDTTSDVIEGLVGLGFNRNDARRAAEKALQDLGADASMAQALRGALNILTGGGR